MLFSPTLPSKAVCLFVCNRGNTCVNSGSGQRQTLSRQGSLVNPLWMCQLHKMEKVAGINSLSFSYLNTPQKCVQNTAPLVS